MKTDNAINIAQFLEEEVHDTLIEKLLWLSASHSKDIHEMLEEMPDYEYEKIFKGIDVVRLDRHECKDDICIEKGFSGFLACCLIPVPCDVKFKDGDPQSWSSSHGHARIFYAYGTDTDLLIEQIKMRGDEVFYEMMEHEKKRQQQN